MIAFVLTSSVILLTPGPTNTVLAASGAAFGLSRARLLPLAEAAGYALAISFFAVFAALVKDLWWALPALKIVAACWLAYSAVRLWITSPEIKGAVRRGAFARVFLTTLVNPKAMIVGTMMIPQSSPDEMAWRISIFIALSSLAGLGWVALGAALPGGIRRHSYKGAAFVLGGFSLYALTSALA
ncbi:threonine transporter [Rhizobium sp. TRM96647]|uniref:LysE family translocator n=1 Tax=unclassified Rhizobium TaxID=2613769 RepID=UPI0021E93EC4|nr:MULTISPECIES: threonine transporter [unclassified Rhizobium]MCV3736673.1 threonine transporter [Rhizobium sp. TRM96647]MCV3756927.1 threonine transporter [Rhizobium sp. TRM96650]